MKKVFVLAVSIVLAMCFVGCGSSSNEAEQNETVSEPNAGLQGIVFTLPDGWTQETEGNSATISNPDSDIQFWINYVDEDFVKEISDVETVQEYYDLTASIPDEELETQNVEKSSGKVCGSDAIVMKSKNKSDEVYMVGTLWITNNVEYSCAISNSKGFDEDGVAKDDAPALTDEELAMYDSILASVTEGDGTQFTGSGDAE